MSTTRRISVCTSLGAMRSLFFCLLEWRCASLLADQKEENILWQRVLQLWFGRSDLGGCHKQGHRRWCVYNDYYREEMIFLFQCLSHKSIFWKILEKHGCRPMSNKVQFIDLEPADHINGAEFYFGEALVEQNQSIDYAIFVPFNEKCSFSSESWSQIVSNPTLVQSILPNNAVRKTANKFLCLVVSTPRCSVG